MKKYIIGASLIGFIAFCVVFNNIIEREYFVLLKRNGSIINYDKLHRPFGEVLIFENGIVRKSLNYKNGKKEGWGYEYYPNGQINNKRYYHLGEPDGPEFQYYENGKLNYKATIKNNKRFGSFYWYLNDGSLNSYTAFDIEGKPFCIFNYNNSGDIIKISAPISPKIYSFDIQADTLIKLKFEEKNPNIKDLYIVIATPPKTLIEISAKVNNIYYDSLKTIDNVIKINDAFPNKGLNDISMTLSMTYRNKKIIDRLNADLSLIKK